MDQTLDTLRDPRRLSALRDLALLDTPVEEGFDRLTRLATTALRVPVSLVSLVDKDRQFLKSCTGLPEPWASTRETPLSHSFCRHAVEMAAPLVVEDARAHPLVRDNPAIQDLGIVAYAGIPLVTSDGHALGTFCAIDHTPRAWTDEEISILQDLAASTMSEIELRSLAAELEENQERLRLALEVGSAKEEDRARLLAREQHERTRAENAEQTLATVIEKVPVGIIVVDAAGHMLLMNEAGRRISGAPPAANVAVDQQADAYALREPLTGRPLRPEETPIGRAVAGETVEGYEYTFQRPGKETEAWVQASASPLIDADGDVTGAVAVFVDITELRRQEREKSDFLSAAAHDLKAPLTTIKGFAQILQRRLARGNLDAERARADLEQIDRTATQMGMLIGELVDATRLQMGEALTLSRASVDLVPLARGLVNLFDRSSQDHEIVFETDAPSLVGHWDEARIQRALSNLISNAVKYSPAGTRITACVTSEETGSSSTALVTVSDQGVGIPADDLPHIFDRFYRGRNAVGEAVGEGMGLTAARHIVEQHGGAISVESAEGEGSTFTIRLPLEYRSPEG